MSVLAAIAVLAILIVVHEMGHFLAARLQGIYANRFSIGFGPILWKYQGTQTEYAIRAFPLGGFVGFPDDDPESTIPPNDPNLLRNRPILDRAIVISAGVIANLVFAYLVFVLHFGIVGIPTNNFQPGVLVPQVLSQEVPAAKAGIQAGDIILAANGTDLGEGETATRSLMKVIQDNSNQPIQLTLQRQGKPVPSVTVTPEAGADGKGRIGVQLRPNGNVSLRRSSNVFEVLGIAAQQFQDTFVRTLQGIGGLIFNFRDTINQLSGPVKIVDEGAKLVRSDINFLLPFTALISISLAVINILPLPALDGGHLVFLLIEGVRGKPLPNNIQEGVTQTGLMLLLGLGIFLIIRDTSQLEPIQNLLR
jgi:membrane-associated protease RseP (regulator of RpoE activity)